MGSRLALPPSDFNCLHGYWHSTVVYICDFLFDPYSSVLGVYVDIFQRHVHSTKPMKSMNLLANESRRRRFFLLFPPSYSAVGKIEFIYYIKKKGLHLIITDEKRKSFIKTNSLSNLQRYLKF